MQIESEATGEPLWQRRALALTDRILEQFMADDGALAMTTNREHLLIELDADGDTVYPSGVFATIDLLIGLGAGNEDYAEAAMRVARHYSARFDMSTPIRRLTTT